MLKADIYPQKASLNITKSMLNCQCSSALGHFSDLFHFKIKYRAYKVDV